MLSPKFLIIIIMSLLPLVGVVTAGEKPDFSAITDITKKKSEFFDYLYPIISNENKKILAERNTLMQVKKITPDVITLCKKYRKSCDNLQLSDIERLLYQVDIIPPSLALAQAANESGWGTSRFAVEGNNYFGQWCFVEGCGIVPARRVAGGKQEVRRFNSTQLSVSSYMRNLNTGKAYTTFREIRSRLRLHGEPMSAEKLANGLSSYSQRGQHYVDEIKNIIRHNKLVEKYDAAFYKTLNETVN